MAIRYNSGLPAVQAVTPPIPVLTAVPVLTSQNPAQAVESTSNPSLLSLE